MESWLPAEFHAIRSLIPRRDSVRVIFGPLGRTCFPILTSSLIAEWLEGLPIGLALGHTLVTEEDTADVKS